MLVKNKSALIDLGRDGCEKKIIEILLNLTEFIITEAQPSKMMDISLDITSETLSINGTNYVLDDYEQFYLIAFGKASQNMSKWLIDKFPKEFAQVILVSPDNLDLFFQTTNNIAYFQGGHPNPNDQSIKAAEKTISVLNETTENDLCLFLISGGGSALLEKPDYDLSLSDYEKLVISLLSSNASIQEINTIRKHFSKIKGGKLAQITKAQIASIILSDVIGNDISSIASGPTAPDGTTWNNCQDIFVEYSLLSSLPESVLSILEKGLSSKVPETPSNPSLFSHVQNFVIGDNTKLLRIMQVYLESYGESKIIHESITGESRQVGKSFARQPFQQNTDDKCISSQIFGGETTVTLKFTNGKGGRNQELAMSYALSALEPTSLYLLSLGTDGIDGNSLAAGAIVGPFTLDNSIKIEEAKKYLEENDSNSFFKKYGGELITGYTGTNLMDVGVIIHYEKE